MKSYKVVELTWETSGTDQVKLLHALRAVRGVAFAQLYPHMGECAIRSTAEHTARFDQLLAASQKVGFSLARHERVD